MTENIAMTIGTATAALVGIAAMVVSWRLGWRKLTAIPIILTAVAFATASVLFWYTHRPLPENFSAGLFTGITYNREVLDGPIIVYTIHIHLDAPGIRIMITPNQPTSGYVLPARTTSQFLQEFGLQVAINADYFDPWRDYGFWDYYPHEGNGVNVRGLTVSQGNRYTEGYAPAQNYNTLFITGTIRHLSPHHKHLFTMPSLAI